MSAGRLPGPLHRADYVDGEGHPDCGSTPHDTPHLFNCLAKPTDLIIRDSWADPLAVENYVGLEGSPISLIHGQCLPPPQ